MLMTVNQLKLHNLAPRGIRATCVPTSICFVTGACYQDVEYVLVKEQPKTYRPDIQGNGGVNTQALLGKERRLFGHRFQSVLDNAMSLLTFINTFKIGTYLVRKKGHVFVVKNGEVFDLGNYSYHETLIGAWKVEKVS